MIIRETKGRRRRSCFCYASIEPFIINAGIFAETGKQTRIHLICRAIILGET